MVKVFVGTDVNGGCAECQMVFEYSIRKHSSEFVDIVWMKISDCPASFWNGWNTETWSTPFSGFRYGIAEYCDFKGKAIYCDDDQLWLDDPVKLMDIELAPNTVMTGKQLPNGEIRHCVSMIDNVKFGSLIQQGVSIHRRKQNANFVDMMKGKTFPLTTVMNDRWNCYDGENMRIEDIGLLHMTDMRTNPGVHMAVKRLGGQANHWYDGPLIDHRRKDVVDIFTKYYHEALEAGYRVENYVPSKRLDYKKQSQKDYSANNGYDVSEGQ